MLHMIINTHNPESCAFRGDEEERALAGALGRLDGTAAEHGITVEGSWVNRAAHQAFFLVDAPNAHVIEDALAAAGMIGRTHTRVLSVISVGAALESVEQT